MGLFELETYIKHRKVIALFAIFTCILAWTVELIGAVYVCPFCRAQRTVIGLLGIILILPWVYHWMAKYFALVIGFFGAVVATSQHFMGWKSISAGKFAFHDNIFIDPFLLSGLALFFIVALISLIILQKKPANG